MILLTNILTKKSIKPTKMNEMCCITCTFSSNTVLLKRFGVIIIGFWHNLNVIKKGSIEI